MIFFIQRGVRRPFYLLVVVYTRQCDVTQCCDTLTVQVRGCDVLSSKFYPDRALCIDMHACNGRAAWLTLRGTDELVVSLRDYWKALERIKIELSGMFIMPSRMMTSYLVRLGTSVVMFLPSGASTCNSYYLIVSFIGRFLCISICGWNQQVFVRRHLAKDLSYTVSLAAKSSKTTDSEVRVFVAWYPLYVALHAFAMRHNLWIDDFVIIIPGAWGRDLNLAAFYTTSAYCGHKIASACTK